MKKNLMILIFSLISIFSYSQTDCTLVFDNGVSGQMGFIEGGIHVSLPDDYKLSIYGEREIIGIEEFENSLKFRESEQQTYEKYKKKYFQKLCGNDNGCGDTDEIGYEITSSNMFGYFSVIYFTYTSSLSTNRILGGWHSLTDGYYTLLISSQGNVVFQKQIELKKGLLVN